MFPLDLFFSIVYLDLLLHVQAVVNQLEVLVTSYVISKDVAVTKLLCCGYTGSLPASRGGPPLQWGPLMSASNMSMSVATLILKTNGCLGKDPLVSFPPESAWPWANQGRASVYLGAGGQLVHDPAVHKPDFSHVSHCHPLP